MPEADSSGAGKPVEPVGPSAWVGRHSRLFDALIAVILFSIVLLFISSDRNPYEKNWEQDTFYQKYFATAVMWVCGHGWHDVGLADIPDLRSFVQLQSNRFECDSIPEDAQARKPNYQAAAHFYLYRTVALFWKWTGEISWTGLKPLFGGFCGVVTALSYGIFRLGMNRWLAMAGTLIFFPFHLTMSYNLRDYGKAPWILLNLLLLGWLIKHRSSDRTLIWIAALAGLGTGIGRGFRPDVIITIPLVLLTLILLCSDFRWKTLKPKILASLAFGATYMLAFAPVRAMEHDRHGTSHVLLLGFENRILESSGLEPAFYDWVHIFSDKWIDFQIKTYGLFERDSGFIPSYSEAYEEYGTDLLFERFLRYPGDVVARAFGSIFQITEIPYLIGLILILYFTISRRQAFFLFAATAFMAAYPSLQFQYRHYFHVDFISLWFLLFGLQGVFVLSAKALRSFREGGRDAVTARLGVWWRRHRLHLILTPAMLLVVSWVTLAVSRHFQTGNLTEYFTRYENASLSVLELEEVALEGDLIRLEPEPFLVELPTRAPEIMKVGYLVVTAKPEICPVEKVEFTTRFRPSLKNFSRSFELPVASDEAEEIFVPIYSRERSTWGNSEFLGVELAGRMRECIRLKRLVDPFSLAPIEKVRLAEGWRDSGIYYRLAPPPGWDGLRERLARSSHRWKKILRSVTSR